MDTATKLAKNEKKLKEAKRQLARVQTTARKRETRRKILVGSFFLNKYRTKNRMEDLKKELNNFLTKEHDRELFGLEKKTIPSP